MPTRYKVETGVCWECIGSIWKRVYRTTGWGRQTAALCQDRSVGGRAGLVKKNFKAIGTANQLKAVIGKGDKLSIRRQCELLGLSRSSVYYQGKGESPQNLQLMRLLDERHLQHPTHGVLQMQDFLCLQGYQANHKRVRRLSGGRKLPASTQNGYQWLWQTRDYQFRSRQSVYQWAMGRVFGRGKHKG